MRVENGGSANRIPEGMANYFSSAVRPPWIWFDRLMMAVARREIDMVAAWSADRLGRPLTDLLSFLTDLHAKGSICFSINRASIRLPPAAEPCFRCSERSRSSSEP
jgi:Resolvase, N terminal domain